MAESQFDVEGALSRLADAELILPQYIPNLVVNETQYEHEDENEVPVDQPNSSPVTSGLTNEHQQSPPANEADLAIALIAFQEEEMELFSRRGPVFRLSGDVELAVPEDYIEDEDRDEGEDRDEDEDQDEDEDRDKDEDRDEDDGMELAERMELDSLPPGSPVQPQLQDTDSEVQALQAVVSAVRLPASVAAPSPEPSSQLTASIPDLTICHSSLEPINNLAGIDGPSISIGISEDSTLKVAGAPADWSGDSTSEYFPSAV